MALLSLPYGRGHLSVSIDDNRLAAVLTPNHMAKGEKREQDLVREALENPIDSPGLCQLAQGKQRILIITSDHTRPVPSAITLPLMLEEIRKGAPEGEVIILVATGVHRPTTEAELRDKLGDVIVDTETIVVHRSEAGESMAHLGTLPSGGELWLNGKVLWADLIVSDGFIEPHFFAGFSGGRKSILPGIASRKTVLYNHNAAFIQSPHARQGRLENNPIHRDMCFAAEKAGLQFILNVLLDSDKKIIHAVAGHPESAHKAGCEQSLRLTSVPCVAADIVLVTNGGYPLDQNIYQAVKGMTAAEACVRQDGVIIMCAALADGHGGEDFFRWFSERDSPQAVTRAIESVPPEDTTMDQWEAQLLARVLDRARCIMVTGEENKPLVEAMHMQWASSPETALALADQMIGRTGTVVVIPDGVGVIVT